MAEPHPLIPCAVIQYTFNDVEWTDYNPFPKYWEQWHRQGPEAVLQDLRRQYPFAHFRLRVDSPEVDLQEPDPWTP